MNVKQADKQSRKPHGCQIFYIVLLLSKHRTDNRLRTFNNSAGYYNQYASYHI